MDLNQIKQILDLVREHELSEFEIEHDGLRLKVRKDVNGAHVVTLPAPVVPAMVVPGATAAVVQPVAAPAAAAPPAAAGPAADAADTEIELAVVKSPIVGTFYRSSEPGAAPFVDIGTTVKKGQVLCIIEAMKLMNEIESECAGTVVECYAQNGKAVEFGQKLFRIKKA